MENSLTNGTEPQDGRPIIVWVVLLFTLILVFELPFIVNGLTVNDLGKLRLSSPLGVLCIAGFILVGYAPTLSALLVAKFHPQGGGVHSVLRLAGICRVSAGWYAVALFGPALLFVLDEGVHRLLGGTPPKHWVVFPTLAGFFPGSLFFAFMGVLAGTFGEEFGWRGFAQLGCRNDTGLWQRVFLSAWSGGHSTCGSCRSVRIA